MGLYMYQELENLLSSSSVEIQMLTQKKAFLNVRNGLLGLQYTENKSPLTPERDEEKGYSQAFADLQQIVDDYIDKILQFTDNKNQLNLLNIVNFLADIVTYHYKSAFQIDKIPAQEIPEYKLGFQKRISGVATDRVSQPQERKLFCLFEENVKQLAAVPAIRSEFQTLIDVTSGVQQATLKELKEIAAQLYVIEQLATEADESNLASEQKIIAEEEKSYRNTLVQIRKANNSSFSISNIKAGLTFLERNLEVSNKNKAVQELLVDFRKTLTSFDEMLEQWQFLRIEAVASSTMKSVATNFPMGLKEHLKNLQKEITKIKKLSPEEKKKIDKGMATLNGSLDELYGKFAELRAHHYSVWKNRYDRRQREGQLAIERERQLEEKRKLEEESKKHLEEKRKLEEEVRGHLEEKGKLEEKAKREQEEKKELEAEAGANRIKLQQQQEEIATLKAKLAANAEEIKIPHSQKEEVPNNTLLAWKATSSIASSEKEVVEQPIESAIKNPCEGSNNLADSFLLLDYYNEQKEEERFLKEDDDGWTVVDPQEKSMNKKLTS